MRARKYYNGKVKYTNLDLILMKNANYVDKTKEYGNISLNARI